MSTPSSDVIGIHPIPRSYLFVPGTRKDRFDKALRSGADAVIFDLEDAVPAAEKVEARSAVGDFLSKQPMMELSAAVGSRSELWVRTNPGLLGAEDLKVVAGPQLDGVCPAKTSSLEEMQALDARLRDLGSRAAIEPLIEDAAALLDARQIASGPRVRRLHLGEGDLAADLGLTSVDPGVALAGARYRIVLESAAARVDSPVAPVSTNYRDLSTFQEETRYLRSLGFWSRACIHPDQVRIANEVFVVSESEIEWVRDVLARLEDAERRGEGVAVGASGQMIDEAIARIARRLWARARQPFAR